MTRSSRRRVNRNALIIVDRLIEWATVSHRWPESSSDVNSVQVLASKVMPSRQITELRAEGVNWSLVAEWMNIVNPRAETMAQTGLKLYYKEGRDMQFESRSSLISRLNLGVTS